MNEEDFYFEESNVGQVIVKIILFIILVIGVFFLFNYFKNRYTLKVRDVKYEVGDELSLVLDKYLKSKKLGATDEYILELSSVPNELGKISKAGEYSYYIEYKNMKKTGKIIVTDTVAPKVEVETLTVGLNEKYTGDDFLLSCDDYSKPCRVEFKNESDYELSNKEGTYDVELIVSDAYDNKSLVKSTLIVKKGAKKDSKKLNDLEISYISPKYDDYDNNVLLKYKKAISPMEKDETDLFEKLLEISGSDLHKYLSDEYQNNQIKSYETIYIHNKYGYVIGYTIRVVLDNKKVFYLKEIDE